jgi:hypothetical protein
VAASKLGIASGCSGVGGCFGKAGVSTLLSVRAVNWWWHPSVRDTSCGLIDRSEFAVSRCNDWAWCRVPQREHRVGAQEEAQQRYLITE